jgi:hypothetical protein
MAGAAAGAATVPLGLATTIRSLVANPRTLEVQHGSTRTVGISLPAAPSSEVKVTTVQTSGNPGLTVDDGESLTFTPDNFSTPKNVTIRADASGAGQAKFTASAPGYASLTITATETTIKSLVAKPEFLKVQSGSTSTVGISLPAAPSSDVSVSTLWTSGNSGLRVADGESLTFTPDNFSTPQNVTIRAAASGAERAKFTASAPGYASRTITAETT